MSYSIFGPIYQYALNNFRGAASLVPIVQHACKLTGGLIQKWTEVDKEIRPCDVILERVLELQANFS